MKHPPAFLCAIIAFVCLLPLNAAAFAQQQAPSALDKEIQTAEDEIQKLQDFIKDPSTSNSLRAGLEPALKNRKGRLEDLKKLRSLPVKLSSEELQNVITTLNAAPAGATNNEAQDDPKRPPILDDKPMGQWSNAISGRGAKPGAQVEIFVNDRGAGTTTSSAEGTYNLDVADLTPGDRVKVRQTYTPKNGEPVISHFSREKTMGSLDPNRGAPVGFLLGGIVMSQQAKEFSQADPFFGFVGGYRFGRFAEKNGDGLRVDTFGDPVDEEGYRIEICDPDLTPTELEERLRLKLKSNGKSYCRMVGDDGEPIRRVPSYKPTNPLKRGQWNVLFQGVFQADARAVSDKKAFANAPSFDPFIVSRKTFNIGAQLWWDFKISRNVQMGPYGAWGGSTTLSKNETQGETTNVDGDQPINIGAAAKIDNDMKQYKEYGMHMTVFLLDRKLYLESVLARGNYEALKGLAPNVDSAGRFIGAHDTQRRFIGKLRIVPEGLSNTFGEQRAFTPIFGVEVNAGYGPDQLKFFFGSIIRIKGLTQ